MWPRSSAGYEPCASGSPAVDINDMMSSQTAPRAAEDTACMHPVAPPSTTPASRTTPTTNSSTTTDARAAAAAAAVAAAAAREGTSSTSLPSDSLDTTLSSVLSLPIHYACISRGSYVQAEFTPINEGEEEILSNTSRKALLRLPRTPGRRSYVFDSRLFSFYIGEDGETFLCVTSEHVAADLPWSFLSDLRAEYRRQMELAVPPGPGPRNFHGEMLRALVRLVDLYNRGKGSGTQQVARVEKELQAVTEIVKENIVLLQEEEGEEEEEQVMVGAFLFFDYTDTAKKILFIHKMLERGEQIESLVGKTSTLADSAFDFRKEARALRRTVWWSSAKNYIIVGAALVNHPNAILHAHHHHHGHPYHHHYHHHHRSFACAATDVSLKLMADRLLRWSRIHLRGGGSPCVLPFKFLTSRRRRGGLVVLTMDI